LADIHRLDPAEIIRRTEVGAVHFPEATFQTDVLESSQPTLVDFTAAWCGPCKQMTPIVEQLAETYAGQVQIGKIDVDESPGVAAKYGIRSIPTLLFFRGGELVDELRGLVGKDVLEAKLKETFQLTG
jgi:thioredoxin 1